MDVVSARPNANIRRRTNPEQTICASEATNRPILDGGRQAKPSAEGTFISIEMFVAVLNTTWSSIKTSSKELGAF